MTNPAPTHSTAHAVTQRLDQVVGRVRLLRATAGVGRLLWRSGLALLIVYLVDRSLDLPVGVRAALLLILALAWAREVWLRLLMPQVRAPNRLAAARLVERVRPDLEGRLVSALQLPAGGAGSLTQRVHDEAAQVCAEQDLRGVLAPKPSLIEFGRAMGLLAVLLLLVAVARPALGVFAQRWSLQDVAWPRDTVLSLEIPARSAVHAYDADMGMIAARGGVVQLEASWDGVRPERPELVVIGARGERTTPMLSEVGGRLAGHFVAQPGDERLFVRGGDDDGRRNRVELRVVEPPTMETPRFVLHPPEYLGLPAREVGSEDLMVVAGTRVEVLGEVPAATIAGELRLLGAGEVVALELDSSGASPVARAEFLARESDTLVLALTGEHGLQTPDPANHALLVREDKPPTLRLFSPARSDVKVSARAAVPIALLAEDDYGVESVNFSLSQGEQTLVSRAIPALAARPGHHRLLLDLTELEVDGTLTYALEAEDGRELEGRGAQLASVSGRRIDVVEDGEVQRLLSERQLRLKEAYTNLRERQQRASEAVADLVALGAEASDADLVAATVAQGQVGNRLDREARELCGVLEEALLNRLDAGPGAEALLGQHLTALAERPVDEVYAPQSWRELAAAYSEGRFGRLDLAGRLLDMTALALQLSEDLAPATVDALALARSSDDPEELVRAAEAQRRVGEVLDRLIDRMDEWEDYQEVLSLVKSLIDDQKSLRIRTQDVLTDQTQRN